MTSAIRDALLPEFDQEQRTTCSILAAVPEAKTSFRPHPKSWTLGELSLHVANVLTWLPMTLRTTELDLDPPEGPISSRSPTPRCSCPGR
jgi:hypothetical protein